MAILLLAIGLSGAAATILSALRLEMAARRRADAVRHAARHLDWFEGAACPLTDTTWTDTVAGAARQSWALASHDSIRTLTGLIDLGPSQGRPLRLELVRRCVE